MRITIHFYDDGEDDMNHKYFFLYLKTGGGHLAPAKSVTKFLKSRYNESLDPMLIDGLDESPRMLRTCLEDGYRRLQKYARWMYAVLYFVNKWHYVARCNAAVVSHFVQPYLEKRILAERPEKIVIFHFFLIQPVHDILRRNGLAIPTLVVVTDPFTAHPLWFLHKEQHFIVFSEQLRNRCLENGISGDRISVFSFILGEHFGTPPSNEPRESIKERHGFTPASKLILIIGGADGIPRGKKIVKHLLRESPGVEVAVVCGNNLSLYAEIDTLRNESGSKHLKVLGFVDSVHELLYVSDVVITKCGASMFMETLLSRKIPIVNNYLWEQEKGNVDYIREHRMGIYEKKTRRLSWWINKLLSDNTFYGSYNSNIDRAHLVNGVRQVSDFIVKFRTA